MNNCLAPFKVGMNQLKSVVSLPSLVLHFHFQVLQQFIWKSHNQYLQHRYYDCFIMIRYYGVGIILQIFENSPRSTSSSSHVSPSFLQHEQFRIFNSVVVLPLDQTLMRAVLCLKTFFYNSLSFALLLVAPLELLGHQLHLLVHRLVQHPVHRHLFQARKPYKNNIIFS